MSHKEHHLVNHQAKRQHYMHTRTVTVNLIRVNFCDFWRFAGIFRVRLDRDFYDAIRCHFVSLKQKQPVVLAFDPGAMTGVAIVSENCIVGTYATEAGLVVRQARRLHRKYKDAPVVIECGPAWRSDSPLTRNVEGELKRIFQNAALVPPNRWKGHPAAQCEETLPTVHQRDAVCLARWFMAKGALNGKSQSQTAKADTA